MAIRSFIFLFVLLWSLNSCSRREDKVLPVRQQITESVYASVTIQPDSLYNAFAAVNGILDENFIEEGQLVKQGMVLHQVINSNPKLNTENARLSLDLAKKNYEGSSALLGSIEAEIESARLSLSNDSINYCRQKNLWDQQIGSQVEYDAKKLQFELSKRALKLLIDKYHRTKDELQTQVKQARNNFKTSLITTEDFAVESKIDGKVYAVFKNPGEIVTTMEPLSLVGSASDFVIEMLVDEVDIVKIQLDQKVWLTLDAYSGQVYTAKVDKIYPKKDERNQTFIVEALFNDPPKVLYPGLAGEANILIAEKKEALIIPKQYLIDGDKVKTDDGLVAITIGLQNMDSLEVISGINANTWIYKPAE